MPTSFDTSTSGSVTDAIVVASFRTSDSTSRSACMMLDNQSVRQSTNTEHCSLHACSIASPPHAIVSNSLDELASGLEKAVNNGWDSPEDFVGDPDLASLKSHPRYAALVAAYGRWFSQICRS